MSTVARAEARSHFPLQFQDEESSRYALELIWNHNVPVNARRKYLWSMGFASIAAGCLTLLMAAQGPAFGALLFGGVFVIGVVITTKRLLAHRNKR
jgi:uncharacterized membrane protein HdeD (DUF308 family)